MKNKTILVLLALFFCFFWSFENLRAADDNVISELHFRPGERLYVSLVFVLQPEDKIIEFRWYTPRRVLEGSYQEEIFRLDQGEQFYKAFCWHKPFYPEPGQWRIDILINSNKIVDRYVWID